MLNRYVIEISPADSVDLAKTGVLVQVPQQVNATYAGRSCAKRYKLLARVVRFQSVGVLGQRCSHLASWGRSRVT